MSTNHQAAQVTLPSDRAVEVTRSFRAPRALVYEAFTKPELLRRWMLGIPGWSMPVCEMDVRVDGRFRWRWRSDEDGREFGFHGVYVGVETPALLRHTEAYDPGDIGGSMGEGEALVTVRFEDRNGGTTVTTLIEYASMDDRDMAMSTGMTDGMEISYRLLDELLAKAATPGSAV